MRWGVRDEATDDHSTTGICLEEIQNCKDMSLGPNFVFLGGQKYGFRPIPNSIECDEYNLVKKTLTDLGRDVTDYLERRANDKILPIRLTTNTYKQAMS